MDALDRQRLTLARVTTRMEVFLNNRFLPLSDARISVLDRGFLFGDGVYEVIPVYGGRLFRLEQHLQRLDRSLRGIHMENPWSRTRWQEMLEQLITQHEELDQSVYLQVTRGSAEGRDHAIPAVVSPTLFAMATPMAKQDPATARKGVAAITADDTRWSLCNIKSITLLANVLHRQEAAEKGALEAILVRDGLAVEGAASNLFIVDGGILVTPPNSAYLLPGVTRDLILELAEAAKIAYRESSISLAQLESAAEIWLTSSTREIMPVTRLNDRIVGEGIPGPLWHRMFELYQAYKDKLRTTAP